MTIKILGAKGCSKCAELQKRTEEVAKELEKDEIEVKKINDPTKVVEYGVMSTPALVIDDKVVFSGKIASKEEIKKLLK